MNTITKAQPGIVSPLMNALHGRKLILKDIPDCGHSLTAYTLLHQRLARGISAAIDKIDAEEERRKKEGYDPSFAADAFKDAVYRAAELFEFYEQDLLRYLGLEKSQETAEYCTTIKTVKRTWLCLCNKCKHNHAFLVPIEGLYDSGDWVTGFSLYRRQGDKLAAEKDLYCATEIFSYNWILRALFADVIKADMAAAKLVSSLKNDESASPLSTFGIPFPYPIILSKVAQRSKISMPRENLAKLYEINFTHDEILISETQPVVGKGKFRMLITIDVAPGDLKVSFPYQLGECRIQHEPKIPTGVLYRAIASIPWPESVI